MRNRNYSLLDCQTDSFPCQSVNNVLGEYREIAYTKKETDPVGQPPRIY